jgi:DNA-binding response OmpR family regulator
MPKKIMIVDDDPNIVAYLKEVFEDNGYDTCTASDGTEAMEVVRREKPDLITLDLEMPDEWGPKFFRNLSKEDDIKHIPVIVVSGLAGNKYAIPKAVASFSKPFDRNGLLKTVKEHIG